MTAQAGTISLGSHVRDKVSRFEGIAIGYAEYLYDLPSWQIAPLLVKDDGMMMDAVWVSAGRVERVS